MKRQVLGFLLLLSLTFPVSAQRVQTGATSTPLENLRRHVEYLASPGLEGRRTGDAGATVAAGYIANMFARFKLKPGASAQNGKPNYMQPFPYVTGVEMAAAGNDFRLAVTQADGTRKMFEGPESAIPVGFSSNATIVNANVVYAGFGIVAAEAKYDDYRLDVRGKVVLVSDGNPDGDSPHSAFGRFDVRTKALIAKEKGAAGMLVISREAKFADDKLTRLAYDQTLGEAALPTFVISRAAAQAILGITERDLANIEGVMAMKKDPAVKVEVEFRDTQPTVSFSVELVKKQADAYNIIGTLEGRDKTLKNEAIVIGAHYDHLGRGGQGSLAANSSEIHHGADDNASGTAAILELARMFASEKKNKRTIIFIAFSGEEEGLLGSKFYVNNPVFPIERTVAMINLDMVGRLNNRKLNIGGIGTATEMRSLIEKWNINEAALIPIAQSTPTNIKTDVPALNKFDVALNEDGFGPSDHSSFYGKKVPVLFFFTGTHADYHKPSDTAEKINFAGLDMIRGMVADIVRDIDQNPIRPTYTVAKSSGMAGGRTGFNISLGTIPSYAEATDGMVLDGVRDDSPGSKAGLKAGDKIIKLAGRDIRNVMDYTYTLGEMKADQEYEVVVMRGSESLTFTIVPAKR